MAAPLGPELAAGADSFVLRNTAVLGPTGHFDGPVDVLVEEGIIRAIGAALPTGQLPTHDLDGAVLVPGFFDCHLHVSMSSTDPLELMQTPLSLWALRGAENARRTVAAGFTSARDAGGADTGFRTAISRGIVPGPRLQLAIVLLSATGGHADGYLSGPGIDATAGYLVPDYPGRPHHLVDGTDQMRRAVRQVLRAGGDWIKLCATGGFNSPHDDPHAPEFSFEEIATAVSEAAQKKKSVMAHAFGGEGIDNALEAGIRSLEHGTFLTERQAQRMAERNCWLVPTLSIQRDVVSWADAGEVPDYFAEKVSLLRDSSGEAVRIARDHGVKIAVGTDFFRADQHGGNLRELGYLCDAGMSVSEVLIAATSSSADLCGVGDRLGTLAPGYTFDAVVLDSEPVDGDSFRRKDLVQLVFQGGRYVDTSR
jgi:imidazolonepropionase-like amidohydrolase